MTSSTVFRWTLSAIAACVFSSAPAIAHGQVISAHPAAANKTSRTAAGHRHRVRWRVSLAHDNLVHSEVQLAARLRKEYPAGVDVETFESYRGEEARQEILKLLDTEP